MSNSDLVSLVNYLFTALTFVVIGRALLSWFDPGLRSSVGRVLVRLTEPFLGPIRRLLPSTGMIDLSPIILIVLLQAVRQILIKAIL